MKKILTFLLAICMLFASCANSYSYKNDKGLVETAEPYGWADYQKCKADGVIYQVNIPNVVISVIFAETIIIPIWLTGYQLFEPIGVKGQADIKTLMP